MNITDENWDAFNNGIVKKNLIKIYLVYNNNDKIYVATKQDINKYLKSIKSLNRNKNKKLFDIVNSDLYNSKFVEYFEYINKSEINQKITDMNLKLNDNVTRQNFIDNAVIVGNGYEDNLLNVLKSYFSENIITTRKNKHCNYDYLDTTSGYKLELKTNNYSIDKYANAVIGIDKLKYNKLILLFNYIYQRIFINKQTKKLETKEEVDTYYIIYDKSKFDLYNRRQIFNNDRQTFCNVIDIPTKDLIYLNPNEKYTLEYSKELNEGVLKLITTAVNSKIKSEI